MTTIMDKSLGTFVQFDRFLTHAKLFSRATSTVRPYPLPTTAQTVLKRSKHNSFDLLTLYWAGRGEGTWIRKNTALLFATELVKFIELSCVLSVPSTFVHDCSVEMNDVTKK